MKSAMKMVLTLAAVCLLMAVPAMAARDLLAETTGPYQQCGGKGDGCTGSKCADAPWAMCSTSGFACYRISEWYWQCDTHQPAQQPTGAFSQCGGEGGSCNAKAGQCKDAEWSGATCPAGYACQRINNWWWQCNKAAGSEGSPTPVPVKPHTPAPTKPHASAPTKPHAPAPTKPHTPATVRHVHTYAQCGGQGGSCTGADCKDAAWPDVACLSYDVCTRINNWWWQCNLKPKAPTTAPTPTPAAPAKPFHVGNYDQCGGAGGHCTGAQCKDATWPGATCPTDFKCYRVSQWWWQCDTHTLEG